MIGVEEGTAKRSVLRCNRPWIMDATHEEREVTIKTRCLEWYIEEPLCSGRWRTANIIHPSVHTHTHMLFNSSKPETSF